MSDFTDRLADRYSDESQRASKDSDNLGEKVFDSLVELVDFASDPQVSIMPDEVSASLFESAIRKQKKWSPTDAKAKWGLALNILNDEKVSLRLIG